MTTLFIEIISSQVILFSNCIWYIQLENNIKGSTTIENIVYEKYINEEVSRVGLLIDRNGGHYITSKRKYNDDIVYSAWRHDVL